MSFPWLFLWLNVYPAAIVTGVAVAFAAYWIAHPRSSERCLGVLTEAWRLYAFVPAVAGFAFGAQLHLWLTFAWRPPFTLSHLGTVFGLMLIALAPTPLVVAVCNGKRRDRRALALAGAALLAGAVAIAGDVTAFRGSWNRLADSAVHHPQALYDVGMLKGLRYVSAERAIPAVDAGCPDVDRLVDLVDAARAGTTTLDQSLREHIAGRIVAESVEDEPYEAASAVWWLTGRGDDLAQAYGNAHPDAAVPDEGGIRALEAAVIHLVHTASESSSNDRQKVATIVGNLLTALDAEVGTMPLSPEAESAVTRVLEAGAGGNDEQPGVAPPSVSDMAFRILFRNGSRSSLRVVLPRFRNPDDPAWSLLITDCPKSTQELIGLVDDSDPAVAEGAGQVLSWVQRYCVSSEPGSG